MPWYRSQNFDARLKMERIFRDAFSNSGYEIVVKHDAEGHDLQEALTSNDTVGVFWVSHAIDETKDSQAAVGYRSKIVATSGEDVKNVFRRVSPFLRFLGIIGCKTKPIIDNFISQGAYASNPGLTVVAFDKKVDGITGLKKAIRRARSSLEDVPEGRPDLKSDGPKSGVAANVEIQIERKLPNNADPDTIPEVQLFLGQYYLGLMGRSLPGKVQTLVLSEQG